jgi:hypothetical protein
MLMSVDRVHGSVIDSRDDPVTPGHHIVNNVIFWLLYMISASLGCLAPLGLS